MRSLQAFQVVFFVVLSFDNCVAHDPDVIACITVPVNTSCQAEFGNDPGDSPCSGNTCDWTAPDYECDPFDTQEETRSLPAWNTAFPQSNYASENEIGVYGKIGIVQCVAKRKCRCMWNDDHSATSCSLDGAHTQQALKFFLYATYVTSEICPGGASD